MQERGFENNMVIVSGEMASDFSFSHEVYGERFYSSKLNVSRLSETIDTVPILVSNRITDVSGEWKGKYAEVVGDFRSYNNHTESGIHMILYVFAKEFIYENFENEERGEKHDKNIISLNGFICKEPSYRKTPLGREVTDILLATNRAYGKSDYTPCICWGRNARFAGNLEVGTHIRLEGRIQSREYLKKISDTETETRVAYEVSASKIEVAEETES